MGAPEPIWRGMTSPTPADSADLDDIEAIAVREGMVLAYRLYPLFAELRNLRLLRSARQPDSKVLVDREMLQRLLKYGTAAPGYSLGYFLVQQSIAAALSPEPDIKETL